MSRRFLTTNLDRHVKPTIADAPCSMRVRALETLDANDPLRSASTTPCPTHLIKQTSGHYIKVSTAQEL